MQEVDLLIIGCGPAGLSTALHLVKQDASWIDRMVLIEKTRHPRPKLCAGGVTSIGLETLRDLGLHLPLPIPSVAVEEAHLIYEDSTIRVKGHPIFMVYNRIEFDAFLYQYTRKQGIAIYENEEVQAIREKPQKMEVTTSKNKYLARVVVGADGSKGITRRLVKKPTSKGRVARLLETIFPAQGNEAPFSENFATFSFTPNQQNLQGYYWEFPSFVNNQPHFNRGIYDSRCVSVRERADLPSIFTNQIKNDNKNQSDVSLQGHPIHWFHPRNRLAIPHILLVGDAAGVDPLFGEGIGPALAYGKLAAEELKYAFQYQEFSFRQYKRRLWTSSLGRYLLYRWIIARLSYQFSGNPLFMKTLWQVGKVAATLWPKPNPFNYTKIQDGESASRDRIKDYVD